MTEGIQSPMRHTRIISEFYGKLWIVALVALAGCATTKPSTPQFTTVYLVRHAEKSTAIVNDPDPDISVAGLARSRALADRLRDVGLTGIVITQLKRTGQTALPLIIVLKIAPDIVPTGGAAHADSVAAAVMRHRGGKILVVGHSNTIAGIIAALGGPHLPNLCDAEYSNMFVMNIGGARSPTLVRIHYGAADPPPDSACLAMVSH